jgi:signal transduction histidine kinase
MELREVLPLLIPAALLQLFIQVLYIKRCLKDQNLTRAERRLYAVMIAVFSLPAAAVYLFKSGERRTGGAPPDETENVAPQIRRGIFLLLVTAYEVLGLHMLAENAENPLYLPLVALLSISFLLMLLHNLRPAENRLAAAPLFPVLQFLLCVPILYLDHSGDNLYLALIAGISAINYAPLSQAKVYGIGALGAYLVGSTAKTILLSGASETGQLVQYFFVNTLVVLLALVAFYTLKKQMVTGRHLDAALHKVKEQAEQLKGLAVIEERNRIAAEMHDTVGHTLTAAVLSLEAAEGLLSEQPPQAAQKLRQGKEQVRRGLSELRASVRAVRAGSKADFTTTLRQLLQEIHSDTGLDVQIVVNAQISLPPLQAGILLSAVKECATNAIRHGRASRADILIQAHKGQLHLAFTDNGDGAADVRFGSGLSIMRERMQSVGGALEIETAPGEGFTVSLTMPAAPGKENAP